MIKTSRMVHVVLVTGPSGAGRTTAINALEDAGFEAIDNMPLTLAPRLFEGSTLNRPLALGLDTSFFFQCIMYATHATCIKRESFRQVF